MRERLEFLFWKLQGEPPTPELLQAGMAAHCVAVVAPLRAGASRPADERSIGGRMTRRGRRAEDARMRRQ